MRKIQLILLLFFSIYNLLLSQYCVLNGIVTDENNDEPIENASIAVIDNLKNSYNTTTDLNGFYILKIPSKRQCIIKCSYLGYQKLESKFTIPYTSNSKTVNFQLKGEKINLTDIYFEIVDPPSLNVDSIYFINETVSRNKLKIKK